MAIQISGTTVIDNSRNLTNTVNISASGTIAGDIIATQAVAQAGTDNTKLMTPLRVAEAIAALGGQVINRIQKGATAYSGPSATNVPITSVDTSKSMIVQEVKGNYIRVFTGIGADLLMEGFHPGSATLSSSTQVTITPTTIPFNVGPSPGDPGARVTYSSGTIEWQVIEFK
jgi:hypothetical protein